MIRRTNRQSAHSRRGQSLILFLLVLIALIGILALTVDFGFVILARRHMQTGVNSAAKEGLRGEGLTAYDSSSQSLRRNNARDVLRLNFDDDFDLSANTTTIGAGIDASLIQGNGYQATTIGPPGTSLSDDLANRSSFVYRPDDFELNSSNDDHGDMLVGGYDSAASHLEAIDYTRGDFDPASSGSFLIRMRRTHDPNGLDSIPGVSSGSGGLPLILARAGFMRTEDASAAYSVRRDGVTVRATAIANTAPVRSVGVADLTASPPLLGLAPIGFGAFNWQQLTPGVSYSLNTANGNLTSGGTTATSARHTDNSRRRFVGESRSEILLSWPNSNLVADGTDEVFYAAIWTQFVSTTTSFQARAIVGFGGIRLTRSGSAYTVTPLAGFTPAENVSSHPPIHWYNAIMDDFARNHPDFTSLPAAQQPIEFGAFSEFVFQTGDDLFENFNTLRAPVLVRSVR